MTLDPQAEAYLAQQAAAGAPPVSAMSLEAGRQALRARQEAGGGTLPEIGHAEDRVLPGAGGAIPVRLYTPRGARERRPALVYFHGGGWVRGDLETHDRVCRFLAAGAECLVVSVDYRRAPEARFPAAVEDAFAATRWVAEHASEIGADPGRLAVGGDSAGGNLAAVVALLARDAGGPALQFQLLVYPVTDSSLETASYEENASGYGLTRADMAWYWKQYLPDGAAGKDVRASPLRAQNLRGLPPALVITAEYDPLRDEGEAYGRRLRDAGVRVTVTRYPGMVHGFFGLPGVYDQGKRAIDEATAALRAAFSSARALT